ncbi:MAG: ThiF family adenylyltransferase, partial [Patescibacteria group bacterium]|nr:ThiF family adenylyltransferase [Patescibacteria group bacterium]
MGNPADIKPQFYASENGIPEGATKHDMLQSSLRELFFIENPDVQKNDVSAETRVKAYLSTVPDGGVWVYYPWLKTAIRVPSEETYFLLRTARNRDLITEDEQRAYHNSRVGIAGLSVGSAAVVAITATGGPKRMKLADPDIIEITNLNRMQASLSEVGMNKTDVSARAVWERDPFAEIELWREGITTERVGEFVDNLDIFVDEMDDIGLKFA